MFFVMTGPSLITLRSAAAVPFALGFSAFIACGCAATAVVRYSVRLSSEGIHRALDGVIRWSDVVRARRIGFEIQYQASVGEGDLPINRSFRLNPGVEDAIQRWTDEAHPIREALRRPTPSGVWAETETRPQPMLFERALIVSDWNDDVARTAAAYLQSRGFADMQTLPGPSLDGRRGSWVGNFTSFDMTKVRARIRLTPGGPGIVTVRLDVSSFGQLLTDWNRAVWRLELVELYRVLRGREQLGQLWDRLNEDAGVAASEWARTAGFGGQRLSVGWAAELARLETEFEPAVNGGA